MECEPSCIFRLSGEGLRGFVKGFPQELQTNEPRRVRFIAVGGESGEARIEVIDAVRGEIGDMAGLQKGEILGSHALPPK